MAVTDQNVLNEIQAHMVEGVQDGGTSWPSGLWTVAEVIAYANQRQYRFLKETSCVLKRATLVTVPSVQRHPLPTDWIVTRRLVFRSSGSPAVFTEVPRGDGFEADHLLLDWPFNSASVPRLYMDSEIPNLFIQTAPSVNVSGLLQILYTALSTLLSNTGVAFTVPDEFTPAVKWGTMADMLWKSGRAHDPERAGYCEARWQEGVAAANVMLAGWL